MAINILRKGISGSVPEKAMRCPCCGIISGSFILKSNARTRFQSQCLINTPQAPLLPTFECEKCGCIWQWEPDENKTEE